MNIRKVKLGSDTAGEDLVTSLKETGFAIITNHDIDPNLLKDVYQDWQTFFALPEAMKKEHKFTKETQAGWFPFGSENAKDSKVQDLKEFYHFYPTKEPLNHNNANTHKLYLQLAKLSDYLLKMIQIYSPKDVTSKLTQSLPSMTEKTEPALFRIIYYPEVNHPELTAKGAVRSSAHEDINLITLLPAATQPGLQVKDRNGNWIAVETNVNDIVINIGDMLQEATDGYYPSTTHRVVNPDENGNQARYSMPFFVHPKPEVILSNRYTAKEYLEERLAEIGLKK